MDKKTLEELVQIRMMLLENFSSHNDWKNNKNAIMREIEHIEVLEKTIKKIDKLLKGHVTFS